MDTNVATSQASLDVFSTEVHVAWSPDPTYSRLRSAPGHPSTSRMLARPLTVLLVIGTIVPTMATGRITAGLLAWSAALWSFAVLIQIAVAVAVIASAPRRSVPFAQALDLWFAGHLPYSLWLLCGASVLALSPIGVDPLPAVLVSAIVPASWTAVIVSTFCRRVLDLSPSAARRRSAAHFLVTWTIVFSYMAWASGGWFQISDAALRLFRR